MVRGYRARNLYLEVVEAALLLTMGGTVACSASTANGTGEAGTTAGGKDGAIYDDAVRHDAVRDDAAHPDDADGASDGPDASLGDGNVADGATGVVQLFNGRDFTGWDEYLGPPYGSQTPLGINTDPDKVFTVVTVDGAPAIHISGQDWGALITQQEFENYHLHLEFKWGSHAVWPPLTARDSGVMYHSVGPFGAVKAGGGGLLADPPGSGYFLTSMELQIADGDLGSYYSLGPILVDGGAYSQRALTQNENPIGTWNTIDIYVLGNASVHLVNGTVVARVQGAMLDTGGGTMTPLVRGKIQLESESMEIYFRALTVEPIARFPTALVSDGG